MCNFLNFNLVYIISVIACSSIIRTSATGSWDSFRTNDPPLAEDAVWKCSGAINCSRTFKDPFLQMIKCNFTRICSRSPEYLSTEVATKPYFPTTGYTTEAVRIAPEKSCNNYPLLGNNAIWSCTPENLCNFAWRLQNNQKVTCGIGKICCPRPLTRITSTTEKDFNKKNESCTNNSLLTDNAIWSCTPENLCNLASRIPSNQKVTCGTGKICCPQPLTTTTSSTERDFDKKNDSCTHNPLLTNNAIWSCTPESSCPLAKTLRGKMRVTCGKDKDRICCPQKNSDFDKANKIALEKCYEYAAHRYRNYTIPGKLIGDGPINKTVLDCPQVQTLIVGGTYALPKEFPHMALLGYDKNVTNEDSWRCQGSLISEQFILSAAHCTFDISGQVVKWAALGLQSRGDFTTDMIGKNLFRIIQHFNHPLYNEVSGTEFKEGDIALYKLESPITLGPAIRPICIYHESSLTRNDAGSIIVTGWEKPDAGIERRDLQRAKIFLNANQTSQCAKEFEYNRLSRAGFNVDRMICSGGTNGGNKICLGDFGGPMQVAKASTKCMWVQIGIASMGPSNCEAEEPTIYTRVSAFLPWIQKLVWPHAA